MAFPTISRIEDKASWQRKKAYDSTIRSRSQSGHLKTRAGCTRTPNAWTITISALTAAELALIQAHEDAVGIGGLSFTITDNVSDVTRTVRYIEPITYTFLGDTNEFKASFSVEEV